MNKKNNNDDSSDEEQNTLVDEPSDKKPKPIIGVTPVIDNKCRFFIGKDYSNYYEKDFESIEKFDEGSEIISCSCSFLKPYFISFF
jgi:hypothetical protein